MQPRSIATFEPIPPGSRLARVYNGLAADECKSPARYKFHTVICPPVNGGCEIRGLSNAHVTTADKNSIFRTCKETWIDAEYIWWEHNGKPKRYPWNPLTN
jgi:hypothetical protein